MQMKDIEPGQVVRVLPRGTYSQDDPNHWAKATVLATREPLMVYGHSYIYRSFKPTGVRLRLHPPEPERWGKYAHPRSDLGCATVRLKVWDGKTVGLRSDEQHSATDNLPDDEVIVPARKIDRLWDDAEVDAYHESQAAHRQRRAEREADRLAKSKRLQELLTGLGSRIQVPDGSTSMMLRFEQLIELLEAATDPMLPPPVDIYVQALSHTGEPIGGKPFPVSFKSPASSGQITSDPVRIEVGGFTANVQIIASANPGE